MVRKRDRWSRTPRPALWRTREVTGTACPGRPIRNFAAHRPLPAPSRVLLRRAAKLGGEGAGCLAAPGVGDQLREFVGVDRREPNKHRREAVVVRLGEELLRDRKSTRLNSSHS